MTKQSTGITDRNGKMIHVGDRMKCDNPIYTKPKEFIVAWDDTLKKYNLPSDQQLRASCEIVQTNC